MNSHLHETSKSLWNDVIKPLVSQGSCLSFLNLKQSDATWKSYICFLAKGLMCFVLRACIDCLPSLAALKRMHKRTTTSCPLCANHETLHHILNFCPTSLNQAWFPWHHKSVLHHLQLTLCTAYTPLSHSPSIFADLTAASPHLEPLSLHTFCSSQRPDIVIIFPTANSIIKIDHCN